VNVKCSSISLTTATYIHIILGASLRAAATITPSPIDSSGGASASAIVFESIYINAGGDAISNAYVDSANHLWLSDKNFTSSGDIDQQCPASVKHTLDDALYCSERYFSGAAGTFEIPVATNDLIQVVLHFAELSYNTTNERLFHIIVEGQPVVHNYDIYAAAGGFYTASHVFALTTVTDGFLTIELAPKSMPWKCIIIPPREAKIVTRSRKRTLSSWTWNPSMKMLPSQQVRPFHHPSTHQQ
jgi:hypothetical protein